MFEKLQILVDYIKARRLVRITSRQQIEDHQNRQMKRFRKNTLSKLPLYKALINEPLSAFPVMDKNSVQDHFAELNILGLPFEAALEKAIKKEAVNDMTIGMSTGTSGKRGVFLVSKKERIFWLGTMLAKALPDSLLTKQRIALLLAANSELYKTANLSQLMSFQFFDLRKGLENNLLSLKEFNPTILIAPAQVLRLLADQKHQNNDKLNPRKIFSVGEVLDESDDAYIAKVFKQPVHQIYQCTEGFLGITCDHGTLHLNEEYVFFEKEWLDKKTGRFNPVITDFSRTSQAMVRYRMNDILVLKKGPCLCGSPYTAIERIEGRCDDILKFSRQTGSGNILVFPDDLRAVILDSNKKIEDFRLVQTAEDQIEITVKASDFAQTTKLLENCLMTVFEKRGVGNIKIKFSHWIEGQNIARKLRRIQRHDEVSK